MADEPTTASAATGEIIGRMKAKIKELRLAWDAAKGEAETAKAAAAKAAKDYDLDPLKVENERLKSEIRTDRHKATFSRLAKAAGAKEKAAEHLYQLSQWKAEKDDVDEVAMTAAIAKLKTEADYAFEPEGDGAETTTTTTNGEKIVPGSGRGTPHHPSKSGVILTKAQMSDPTFMLNPANKELILSAAKEHRLEGAIGDTKRRP